ncbi:MAG: S24/S26 family peptidase [Actinomycetales bacterium]
MTTHRVTMVRTVLGACRTAVRWTALVLLLGFLGFSLAWLADGGRWVRVETPSMGQAAPVGTLLWTKPATISELKVGDIITFVRPGGDGSVTYTHRVHELTVDGTIRTKGDLPTWVDPWEVTQADLVGVVRMRWPGVGSLITMTPALISGGLAVAAVRSTLSRRYRWPATLLLGSLVLTGVLTWYRPLTNAEKLSAQVHPDVGVVATYVGVGLLPATLTTPEGARSTMAPGEVLTVHVLRTDTAGRFRVDIRPVLPWWWIGPVVGSCCAPAIIVTLRNARLPRPE